MINSGALSRSRYGALFIAGLLYIAFIVSLFSQQGIYKFFMLFIDFSQCPGSNKSNNEQQPVFTSSPDVRFIAHLYEMVVLGDLPVDSFMAISASLRTSSMFG